MVKKILCIDTDTPIVNEYVRGLKKLEPEIRTDFCTSIDEVRKLFGDNYYGLIIIDLSLVTHHVLSFIEEVRRGNYYGDIIFTGSYVDTSVIKKIESLKEIEVMLKPFNIEWFVSGVVKYFRDNISIGNRISTIGPCFYMRLLNLGSCTVTCKISQDKKSGIIYFEKGEIINARSWNNSGELALVDMLDLTDAKIDILKNNKTSGRKINIDFDSLLSIVSSQSSKGCAETTPGVGSGDSGFIQFIIKEIKNAGVYDCESVVGDAVEQLGFEFSKFPSDSEIDLIEQLSLQIKDKSKLIKFKKNMMSFLKDREMGKIKKGG